MLFTLMLFTLFLTLAAAVVVGTATGTTDYSRLGIAGLFSFLLGGVVILRLGAALWLWRRENRARDRELSVPPERKKSRRRKLLASLIVWGIIVTGPFWLQIHFMADDPVDWLVLFAVYLILVMIFIMLPCCLIYGLGRALAEKEGEKEEMDEAKKY